MLRKHLPLMLVLAIIAVWVALVNPEQPNTITGLPKGTEEFLSLETPSSRTETPISVERDSIQRIESEPSSIQIDNSSVALISSTGIAISYLVLQKPGELPQLHRLASPGFIRRQLVPPGAILTPAGHSSQKSTDGVKTIAFAPYALLNIYGIPNEVSIADFSCNFIHDQSLTNYFVVGEKAGSKLQILASPPAELEKSDSITYLPLRLALTDGTALNIDFTKRANVFGECTWSDILVAQNAGPPMQVSIPDLSTTQVKWQKYVNSEDLISSNGYVAQGSWGMVRLPAFSAADASFGSENPKIFNDVPLDAEVLFFAESENGLVGWSTVQRNHGQGVSFILHKAMSVSFQIRASEAPASLANEKYLVEISFTYSSSESNVGKQKAIQYFRGESAADGSITLFPRFDPLALFTWLRPNEVAVGLPDRMNVRVVVPGYADKKLAIPLDGLHRIDLGTITVEPGGDSIVLKASSSKASEFLSGSFGKGERLIEGVPFLIKSTPGFTVEAIETPSASTTRCWLSGKGAGHNGNPFLTLSTKLNTVGFKLDVLSNQYLAVGEAEYRIHLGPEIRSSFSGARLAVAFGDGTLLSYPFSEKLDANISTILEFRGPSRDEFLIVLPLQRGGFAHCYSLNPGSNYIP